jgi:hypothetical protein
MRGKFASADDRFRALDRLGAHDRVGDVGAADRVVLLGRQFARAIRSLSNAETIVGERRPFHALRARILSGCGPLHDRKRVLISLVV